MTLQELEQDCYRRLGFATATVDSATQTRVRALINETQQEILSEKGMDVLLNDTVTFPSVASTVEYSLPPVVADIKSITEATNRRTLARMSRAQWRSLYPDPTALTGIPEAYVDLGFAAVAKQPSNASELFVLSDSASDTSTTKAFIEGYITGGYFRSASVALNGTTAASFGATITGWIEVTKFYVGPATGTTATTAAGNITLMEDSGLGTELARIHIGQSYARYRRIALVPTPASAITYTVEFQRDMATMSNPQDEPLLPPRFHRLLAVGARMREYEKQDQKRYKDAQSEYLYGIKQLKNYLYAQAVGTPNLRAQGSPRRGSRLGSWYPSDL